MQSRGSSRRNSCVAWVSAVALLLSGATTSLLFTQQSQCTSFLFNPPGGSFDYHANASSVTCTKSPAGVSPYTGCSWTASSDVTWISLTGTTSSDQQGYGSVPYAITENSSGDARSGTITFSSGTYGSATFSVFQLPAPPPPCSFSSITASGGQAMGGIWGFTSAGGSGSVTINFTAASGCAWSLGSSSGDGSGSFINFTGPTSGSNTSTAVTIPFTVPPYNGISQSTVLSATVNSVQTGVLIIAENGSACSVTAAPPSISVPAGGGNANTTYSGNCAWYYLPTLPSWVTAPFPGTPVFNQPPGPDTVSYTVLANTGPPRSTQLTTSGTNNNATFTINQAGTASAVTVQTSPPGLQFSVDGGSAQTAPQTLNLSAGSHTISVANTQAGPSGTQYVFDNWSDGGAATHSITVANSPLSFTANFDTQYQLMLSASPATGGTVTPLNAGYYTAGTAVTLTATATSGYNFAGWSGPVANPASPSTTVTMSAPETVTANFAASGLNTITTNPPGLQIVIDGQTLTAPQSPTWTAGSTHSIGVVTPQTPSPGTQQVFTGWSDSGAATHNVTATASGTTYTATFQTQYLLAEGVSPSGAGSISPAGGYFNAGTSLQMSVTAAAGYTFSGWSGDLSGMATPQTLVMGAPHSVTANFSAPNTLVITPTSLPAGLVGVIYPTTALNVTNGAGPYTWTRQGSLPPGMSFSGGGVLSGAPQQTGSFTFTTQVSDSSTPPLTQKATYTIAVSQPTTLLSVSAQQLNFSYTPGAGSPPAQNIGVLSTPAATAVSVATTTSDGGTWLAATFLFSANSMTPGTISVSLNTSGLAPGSTYNGQVNITAPNATPSSISVPVTVQVAAQQGPALSVTPASPHAGQSFTLPQGGQSQGTVSVANAGGGTLSYTTVASSDSGWLSVSQGGTGSVTPTTPATITFTINATGISVGFHQGSITVTDGSGNYAVSVVDLLVSSAQMSMQLSQTGLTFNAVVGANVTVPVQSVSVYNLGSGSFSWTAQTPQYLPASQGGWLNLSATSGNSSGAAPGEFQVSVSPAALTKGQYYAVVSVVSAGAVNSPQSFTVLLNVVNVGDLGSTPQVFSSGGILAAPLGGNAVATETINLFNPAGETLSYSTAVSTGSGSSAWLTVSPASGSLGASGTAALTVNARAAGLTAGLYNGTVEVAFSQGTVETIPFGLVVLPAGASISEQLKLRDAASTVCTPKLLEVVMNAPAGGMQFVAGQPGKVALQISDDCYNLVLPGQNSQNLTLKLLADGAYVSPPVTFAYDNENAVWTGTWAVPNSAGSAKLQVFASVTVPGGQGSYSGASLPAEVQVLPNDPTSGAPQPTPPLNAASFDTTLQGLVVPGEYISIFGQNLATTTLGGGVPLPPTLGGAQLSWNGLPVPLLSVSGGQLNGLVPQQLQPSSTAQLSLQRNNTAAVPLYTQVAEFQPGIFTQSQQGVGQGSILNFEAGVVAGAGPGQQAVSRGGYIEIYATGLGQVKAMDGSNTAPPGDGIPAPASPLFQTVGTVSVKIGGVDAPNIPFAGLSPNYIALYQINVQVPASVQPGTGVPVVLTITDNGGNSVSSQAGVTIAVK